jgi:peptidoglycan/LPS O-acetylase OafA/YrhL
VSSAPVAHQPAHVAASPAFQPPPGNPRFPLVDALRAIAVLMVLLAHAAGAAGLIWAGNTAWWAEVFRELGSGVFVFFVISGFLLYRPFVAARVLGRPRPRIRRYLRRRALRLLPAYWFALTVMTAIGLTHRGAFTSDWWRYYGLLQIYWADTFPAGIQVAWSLCVEASFYAALPLWVLAAARVQRGSRPWFAIEIGGLVLLIAASGVFRGLVRDAVVPYQWASALPGTATFFVLGMLLAAVTVRIEQRGRPTALERAIERHPLAVWAIAVAVFFWTGLQYPLRYSIEAVSWYAYYGNYVGSAIVSFLLVLPAVVGHESGRGLPRRLLAQPWLAWLGLISYGFFLWHLPLLLKLKTTWVAGLPAPELLILVAGGFVLAVLAGAFSYYVVELPFLRLKERPLRLRPRRGRP